jgi:hypothetical protein
MQPAKFATLFLGTSLFRLAAPVVVAAALAGCVAPQEEITWNTPREAPPATPENTPPSSPVTDGQLRDKALQDALSKTAGGPCREFQETIMIGGKPQRAYGTACRQPDGTWKRVSTSDKPTTEAPVSSFPYQGYPGGYAAYPRYYPRYHFGFGFGRHHSHFGYGVHW